MHTNRIFPARKILAWLAAAVGLALLSGCDTVTLTNLTPTSLNENPSQIYTFSLRVTPRTNTVQKASIAPHIIIDGKSFDLKASPLGGGLYDFEYQLPAGRREVTYYYLVNYNIEGNAVITPKEVYTDLTKAQIVGRYALGLEVNRGPVGARIAVVGRGFTPQDTVQFDGQPVRTTFESANALSFYVPAFDTNKNYRVTLTSASGNSEIGSFRIDPSSVTVTPTSLALRTKQRQQLTFTIPNPAPAGGTLLDVTTDVSDSVIMPEVIVPAGQTTVTVTVEGGRAGTGSLFLKGYGAGEVTIPVTVAP